MIGADGAAGKVAVLGRRLEEQRIASGPNGAEKERAYAEVEEHIGLDQQEMVALGEQIGLGQQEMLVLGEDIVRDGQEMVAQG